MPRSEDDDLPRKPRKPAARKPAPADDDDFEILDDEEDERPVRKKLRRVEPEDDDEDERPVRKKLRRVEPEDDEDDDYEDERPRKRSSKAGTKKGKGKGKATKKLNPLIFVGLAVALVFLFCGGGGGVWYFFVETPANAFKEVVKAMEDNDWGKVYDRSSKETQEQYDKMAESGIVPGMQKGQVATGKSGRDIYMALMSRPTGTTANQKFGAGVKIIKTTYSGNKATLTVEREGKPGSQLDVPFIREGLFWKLGKQ